MKLSSNKILQLVLSMTFVMSASAFADDEIATKNGFHLFNESTVGFEVEYNQQEDALELFLTGGTTLGLTPHQHIKLNGKLVALERGDGQTEVNGQEFMLDTVYVADLIEKGIWELSLESGLEYENVRGASETVAKALMVARRESNGYEVEFEAGYADKLSQYVHEYAKNGYTVAVAFAVPLHRYGKEFEIEFEMSRVRTEEGQNFDQPEIVLSHETNNGVTTYFKWEPVLSQNKRYNSVYFGVRVKLDSFKKLFRKNH